MFKKVYIETLGCQMNKSDSERILGMLSNLNYIATDDEKDADLLIINTCNIRQLSNDKAYSQLGYWKTLKKNKPNLKPFEKIKQFEVLKDKFSIDNGMLSQTAKVKRNACIKGFRSDDVSFFVHYTRESQESLA